MNPRRHGLHFGNGETTMQTLKLADDLFPALDAGKKRGTVRTGKRDIELGELMLESPDTPGLYRVVDVSRVTHTRACFLNEADAALDGYENLRGLLKAMHRFYPGMAGFDPVTVIEFRR